MNYKEEKRKLLANIRISLLQKNDDELLDFVLTLNKEKLNNQVPHNSFPVWDIAYRLKTNYWKMSTKQRSAIINTTSYYYTDYVFNKALNNLKRM